jgi:hypothetical protein
MLYVSFHLPLLFVMAHCLDSQTVRWSDALMREHVMSCAQTASSWLGTKPVNTEQSWTRRVSILTDINYQTERCGNTLGWEYETARVVAKGRQDIYQVNRLQLPYCLP